VHKKRVNVIPVRLNDAEIAALEVRVRKTGMSRSSILRKDFLERPETIMELAKLADKFSGQVEGR
jgi:hypothetical protein